MDKRPGQWKWVVILPFLGGMLGTMWNREPVFSLLFLGPMFGIVTIMGTGMVWLALSLSSWVWEKISVKPLVIGVIGFALGWVWTMLMFNPPTFILFRQMTGMWADESTQLVGSYCWYPGPDETRIVCFEADEARVEVFAKANWLRRVNASVDERREADAAWMEHQHLVGHSPPEWMEMLKKRQIQEWGGVDCAMFFDPETQRVIYARWTT